MRNMPPAMVAANLIGVGAVLAVAVWAVLSFSTQEVTSVCEQRYASATEFSYRTQDGARMEPIELQARVGFNEWGVLDNARIVEAEGAAFEDAMSVRLDKGTGSGHGRPEARGGVSFVWAPYEMGGAEDACLSYSVRVPEDFDFGDKGTLPGLFAGRDFDPRGEAVQGAGVAFRLAWGREGSAAVMAQFASQQGWQYVPLTRKRVDIPRGRWVLFEEEVVLNTPGKSDGIVRLWADGHLIAEHKNALLRREDSIAINGILVDVFYGSVLDSTVGPQDGDVLISPISVRWSNAKRDRPIPTASN